MQTKGNSPKKNSKKLVTLIKFWVILKKKKYMDIRGLSGGEKTMTAIALLFSVYPEGYRLYGVDADVSLFFLPSLDPATYR